MEPNQLFNGRFRLEDVYALGVLTFLVLNGELPWKLGPVPQLIAAQLKGEPTAVPVRSGPVRSGPVHRVDALVYRCLARDPGDRPTADEAAAAVAGDAPGRCSSRAARTGCRRHRNHRAAARRYLRCALAGQGGLAATGRGCHR